MKVSSFDSERASYLTLENKAGLSMTFCDLGASIYEMRLDDVPMNIAPKDLSEFETTRAYYGKTIGRISGRIPNGEIKVAGKACRMSLTEGNNAHHGGKSSWAFVRFQTHLEEKEGKTILTYSYHSPDGEETIPGAIDFQTIYEIEEEEASFRVIFHARSDQETVLAPILHPYFNLGEEDILHHRLTLRASQYYEMNHEMVPTKLVPVTPLLDFRKGKEIGLGVNDPIFDGIPPYGYDHMYLLDHEENKPDAILENERFRLEVSTEMPCLLIYSDNFGDGKLLNNGFHEKKHAALAIEASEHPAAARFEPLKANQDYTRISEYRFFRK